MCFLRRLRRTPAEDTWCRSCVSLKIIVARCAQYYSRDTQSRLRDSLNTNLIYFVYGCSYAVICAWNETIGCIVRWNFSGKTKAFTLGPTSHHKVRINLHHVPSHLWTSEPGASHVIVSSYHCWTERGTRVVAIGLYPYRTFCSGHGLAGVRQFHKAR